MPSDVSTVYLPMAWEDQDLWIEDPVSRSGRIFCLYLSHPPFLRQSFQLLLEDARLGPKWHIQGAAGRS